MQVANVEHYCFDTTQIFISRKIALKIMMENSSVNKLASVKKFLYGYNISIIVPAERIFSFLRVSSLFTGGTGFFVTFIAFMLLGMAPEIQVCTSVFLMVFSVYNLNKLTDMREDAINTPERLSFLNGRRRLVLCYSLVAYAISALLVFLDNPMALPIIFIPLASNLIYSIKLIPGLPRIKDIPVMKNLFVALAWTLVCILLPAMHLENVPKISVVLLIFFMLIKLFINAALFDIRDINGDRESGIRTLPVMVGKKNTVLILLGLNSTLIPWLMLIESNARAFPMGLILYGYAYILYFGNFSSPQALDFFVDGEWMLASIALLSLKGWCGILA